MNICVTISLKIDNNSIDAKKPELSFLTPLIFMVENYLN